MDSLKQVDHSAIKTNQAAIILLLLLAYILNAPAVLALVMLVMLVGTLFRKPGFGFIYRVLRNLRLARPDILMDNPEPHLFAQGFGGTVLLIGLAVLLYGFSSLGWALAWVVIALAGLNLFAGFCTGCAVYYWLNRLHVPGFVKSPPVNTFPGLRPRIPVTGQNEERDR